MLVVRVGEAGAWNTELPMEWQRSFCAMVLAGVVSSDSMTFRPRSCEDDQNTPF
jgi:hypothetical protein